MADINDEGNITARCPGCSGALSSFEYKSASTVYGVVTKKHEHRSWGDVPLDFRLYRCAGCGRGGLGAVAYGRGTYPGAYRELKGSEPFK